MEDNARSVNARRRHVAAVLSEKLMHSNVHQQTVPYARYK